MTASEYIKAVNQEVQNLFEESLVENADNLNSGIDFSKSLQTWIDLIPDDNYKILLVNSIQSLEISLLSQTYCLYRNAFGSLRLSLEMLFGGIYFSTNLLDFIEWSKSSKDLNWSIINDPDNGVLSHRFYNAFFPEIKEDAPRYQTKAKDLYRDLSEYVHGNHHTWSLDKKALKIEKSEIQLYKKCLLTFNEIAMFALTLRFFKNFDKNNIEHIEPIILQNLNHILPIHDYLTLSK